jgi:protein-S-isoprenylcysteine O-methyltransferase Ste14
MNAALRAPNNLSPHVYVASALATTGLSFLAFRGLGGHGEYFYVPVILLALLLGLANLVRQARGLSAFTLQRGVRLKPLLKKAVARYLVWLAALSGAYAFYRLHPYYGALEKNVTFFSHVLQLYVAAGLPYFLVTLVVKSSAVEDFYDPAVRLLHMARQLYRWASGDAGYSSTARVFRRGYNRKVLLNLLMRGYFMPIMVVQVYANIDNAVKASADGFRGYDFLTVSFFITSMLWLMDTLNASLCYCIESRWLENRSRSVDSTVAGWLVCIACYSPVNAATAMVFPFGPSVADRYPETLLSFDMRFIYALKIAEILLLVAHVYADVSIGVSGANLTFKRLQTRGPYGLIRHPGTTFKLSLWWLQSAVYAGFWRFEYIFGHLMWNALYILRTVTEERHLGRFEEYVEYKKKVGYRFIPWIV